MDAANQIFIFLVCVLVGVTSGVVYEIFYIVRKISGDKEAVAIVFDAAFFLVFAAMSVFSAVLFSFPNFRVYMFLGNIFGLLLYLKSVHILVAFLLKVCYNKAGKAIKRRKITKNEKKKEVNLT